VEVTKDERTVQVDIGDGAQPSQKNYGTPYRLFAPTQGLVTVDAVTGEVRHVMIAGPMLTPSGKRHTTQTGSWSWHRDQYAAELGQWPSQDAPRAAVALVDHVREHLTPTEPGRGAAGAAYAWGRLLAVYGRYAELAGPAARDEHSKLLSSAFVTPTVRVRMAEAAQRWWRAATSRTPRPGAAGLQVPDLSDLQARLDRYAVAAHGLPAAYLTLGEREQVICGYHHEHAELAAVSAAGTPA
jgi:hypothetical protein